MSKDVSITDLIAKIREMPVGADWVTLTEDQSGWLHMHRAALVLADALESVTVPTENEREVLARIVGGAVYGEPDDLSRATKAADAIIAAGFRKIGGTQ
jgi:hypothetical protein